MVAATEGLLFVAGWLLAVQSILFITGIAAVGYLLAQMCFRPVTDQLFVTGEINLKSYHVYMHIRDFVYSGCDSGSVVSGMDSSRGVSPSGSTLSVCCFLSSIVDSDYVARCSRSRTVSFVYSQVYDGPVVRSSVGNWLRVG